MKKITLFSFLLTASFAFAQNGGDTCGTAVDVTTVGAGPIFSFTGTDIQNLTLGGETDATTRDAAWFSFTPTADGTINVNSCSGGADTRLHISTGACGALTNLGSNDDAAACPVNTDGTGDDWASRLEGIAVLTGTTYYIEWDARWSSAPFNWSLEFVPAPTCSEVTNPIANFLSDVQIDFSWDAAVFGPAVGYNWEITVAGAGQGNSVVASGNVTSTSASSGSTLTINTDYELYIQTDCGANGNSAYLGPLAFTTLAFTPVANDLCAGAIATTVQGNVATAAEAAFTAGSIANTANTDVFGLACNAFTGNSLDDVWYSFVAGASNVNITANVNFDAVLTLFSGDCNNLVALDCADDTVVTAPIVEEINATGLTVGDTYFFRVYFFGENPTDSTFEFAVWTPQTLSNDDVLANTSFTYFPNPVNNILTLKAQNNIESITVFNMLGQAVVRTTPNALESDINMQALNSGTYFAQVTINNVTNTIKVLKQ